MVVFLLNVLLHALLIASLLGFAYFLYRLVLESPNKFESLLRTGTVLSALLVLLGARVAGLSIAEFTVRALSEANPAIILLSAAAPGGIGILLGWYMIRRFRRSGDIGRRIMIFVGTIATVEFILVYAGTIAAEGLALGPAVIPNVSFVVGVVLYVAFTHEELKRTEPRSGGTTGLGGVVR